MSEYKSEFDYMYDWFRRIVVDSEKIMNSKFGLEQGERSKLQKQKGGRRGIKQRILSDKQSPIKIHPAHTITDKGIEIGNISAATRNPDGTKIKNVI